MGGDVAPSQPASGGQASPGLSLKRERSLRGCPHAQMRDSATPGGVRFGFVMGSQEAQEGGTITPDKLSRRDSRDRGLTIGSAVARR